MIHLTNQQNRIVLILLPELAHRGTLQVPSLPVRNQKASFPSKEGKGTRPSFPMIASGW